MPTYATTEEYCRTLQAIQDGFALEIQKLGGRLRALRRLAGLLQLAGASISLPNPLALIPVNQIDFNKYQELVALCPGLLPPYTGQTLDTLKATLEDAYLSLLNRSLTHPWAKMAELQGVLDEEISSFADKIANAAGPAIDLGTCLQAICGAVSGIVANPPDFPSGLAQAAQDIVSSATGSVVTAGGSTLSALNDVQRQLADQTRAVQGELRNLLPS